MTDLFHDVVLGNPAYVEMITSPTYTLRIYYVGLVDEHNKVDFYDGLVRAVDPEDTEFVRYMPVEYAEHVNEHVSRGRT